VNNISEDKNIELFFPLIRDGKIDKENIQKSLSSWVINYHFIPLGNLQELDLKDLDNSAILKASEELKTQTKNLIYEKWEVITKTPVDLASLDPNKVHVLCITFPDGIFIKNREDLEKITGKQDGLIRIIFQKNPL